MGIFISKAGVLDTLQDFGRFGYRNLGINPNGAMDRNALRLINLLLENRENEASLEVHFPAPEIVFEEPTMFALGGADFGATLDKKPVENWTTYVAKNGSKLRFTRKRYGSRCYISIKGGFEIKPWLGSMSTNLIANSGGFEGRPLKSGDRLPTRVPFINEANEARLRLAVNLRSRISSAPRIRIIAGAEYKTLTALSEQKLLAQPFMISKDSNRMGFRLEGAHLHRLYEKELLSSAVNFGTIQLLPSGQLVILLADHQTTGGYPRIGHIIGRDISKVAQCGSGAEIKFSLVTLEEAERVRSEYERELSFLRMGVRFKSENANH